MVIFSVSGSLRHASSNVAILRTMKSLAPAGTEFIIYEDPGKLPHYNPDIDNDESLPPAVKELRGMLNRSHAIIISTPEYANGIPGVLKNALDWLVSTTVLENKPTAILLGSAGDARFARESLVEILTTMNARVIPDLVKTISGSRSKIDDPDTWHELKTLVENLILSATPVS